jgi:tetratricopeptide (TPR) repeat protein
VLADVDFCLSYATSWVKDYDAALFHAERALAYRKQAANDPFALAMAYNRMGYYYGEQDEYENALEMFRLSIGTYDQLELYRNGLQKAIFPSINAAFALCALGRLEEAEALATDCLNWSEQKWGKMNVNSFK